MGGFIGMKGKGKVMRLSLSNKTLRRYKRACCCSQMPGVVSVIFTTSGAALGTREPWIEMNTLV